MVDIIYNFIYDVLIGNTQLQGAQELALMLTYTIIILFVFVLVKLVIWCFNIVKPPRFRR